MPLSVACADLHAIIPTSEGDHMASPAAILSILIRAQTTGKSHVLERIALHLDATRPELSPPMKASDPDRASNRAERRRGTRESGHSAVQALTQQARELGWIIALLDQAGVPTRSYEAQGGGMCDWTTAGRVDHLLRLLQRHEVPVDEGVLLPESVLFKPTRRYPEDF